MTQIFKITGYYRVQHHTIRLKKKALHLVMMVWKTRQGTARMHFIAALAIFSAVDLSQGNIGAKRRGLQLAWNSIFLLCGYPRNWMGRFILSESDDRCPRSRCRGAAESDGEQRPRNVRLSASAVLWASACGSWRLSSPTDLLIGHVVAGSITPTAITWILPSRTTSSSP